MKANLKKKPRFTIFSAWLILGLGFACWNTSSCKHEGVPADQFEKICYTDVERIFKQGCGTERCHDKASAEHGYVFVDYASIMKSITPGDADKSIAYQAMTSTSELMPPDNPLPASKRTLIRLWIEQGADSTSCASDTTVIPGIKSGTAWACYDRDIEPIFAGSCAVADCHDAASHEEGIDLSSYVKAFAHLKPGNPTGSEIYQAITSDSDNDDFMPQKPYSALSKAAIDTIYSWIKRGALNEKCASVCDTTGSIAYASHLKPIIDLACISCHGANSPSGGIKLLTSNDVQLAATTGKLLPALQRTGPIVMPPSYALSICEVKEFELWVNQGYN